MSSPFRPPDRPALPPSRPAVGPPRPPDAHRPPPPAVRVFNGPPPGFTGTDPHPQTFGPPPSAGQKPLWDMSADELQALAFKQAQAYYQPILDELHRQQRDLEARNQGSKTGLQKLIEAAQGSARGLGDETGRGLGDAFAGIAGQAGQEQYLTLSQNEDQTLNDLLGKIMEVTGQIPGQAQQIYGDLSGQAEAHQKASAPIIRSSGGRIVAIDPQTGTSQVLYEPPPSPASTTKKFYTVGSDKSGRTVYDLTTGKVVARVPAVKSTAAAGTKHYFQGPDKQEYVVQPDGSVVPVGPSATTAPKAAKPRFTPLQISNFKKTAADTAKDAFTGIPDPANKGKWILPPQHYQQALNDMVAHGIPLNIAQSALNRYWTKPGYDRDVKQAMASGRTYWFQSGTGRPTKTFQERHPKADAAAETAAVKQWVIVPQGVDRPGVHTQLPVLAFVAQIAQVHGGKLTVGTGTRHRQYVNNNPADGQSAHWTGWAVDLPVGAGSPGHPDPRLTRLGQDALIAAGMPEAQARKVTHWDGGDYNGYNILFNTTVGGNHFNHVHVGLRASRQTQAPTADSGNYPTAPFTVQNSRVPRIQIQLAAKYGKQYGVDPRLLLAIAGHETEWGQTGAGRQGYTLGYGVTDSGIISKYQGVANQYRWAAQTLAKWRVHTLQDILAGKASAYASDPGWERGVASVYGSL